MSSYLEDLSLNLLHVCVNLFTLIVSNSGFFLHLKWLERNKIVIYELSCERISIILWSQFLNGSRAEHYVLDYVCAIEGNKVSAGNYFIQKVMLQTISVF